MRFFTCRVTWRAADVARGTASGCDTALRPRGRARVAARGAGGADAWQEATRTPCGRHVWLDIEGDRILLIGESVPLFIRKISPYFFRVGLCSHTVLPCRRRGRVASVGSHRGRLRSRGPESTRSPIKTRA